MRTLSIAIMAAGVLALAGCGGDDDEGDGASTSKQESPAASGGGSVRLSATDFKFTPDNPSVDEPGTVTFSVSNDGKAPHALEVEGPSGEKETPVFQPGKSATLKVDLSKDGSYTFYCPVGNHRQMGMEGKIKVGSGGGSQSGGGGGGGY